LFFTNCIDTGTGTFTGGVSIGTTNTTGKVSIQQTINDSGLYFFNCAATSRFMFNHYFGSGINSMVIQEFNTCNAFCRNIMSFDAGGNIGINTVSTDQKLVINQGATGTGQGIPATTGTTQNGILRLRPAIGTYGETLDFGMNVSTTYGWIQATNASGLGTNYNLALNPNGGNVGIGINSPQGLLDVYKSTSGGLGGHIFLRNNGAAVANETAIMFVDGDATTMRAAISSTTENSPYFGDIKFKTGIGTYSCLNTRMIINGAGNVMINTTCAAYGRRLTVSTDIVAYYSNDENITMGISAGTGAQSWGIQVCDTGDGSSALHLNARGGPVGINIGAGNAASYPLHVNGTAYATGAAGSLSDCRHKTNIQNSMYGLNEILSLRPVKFNWIEDKINDTGMCGNQLGFIAQEVQNILPDMILTDMANNCLLALKYNEFTPILVKAIQEQQCTINTLKTCLGIS
jgi:hypothetical protein